MFESAIIRYIKCTDGKSFYIHVILIFDIVCTSHSNNFFYTIVRNTLFTINDFRNVCMYEESFFCEKICRCQHYNSLEVHEIYIIRCVFSDHLIAANFRGQFSLLGFFFVFFVFVKGGDQAFVYLEKRLIEKKTDTPFWIGKVLFVLQRY